MIQTPKARPHQSNLIFYGGLLALWLLLGAAVLGATVFAGGVPHTDFVSWPFVALRSIGGDHWRALPWHWVGARTVRSPAAFWAALASMFGLAAGAAILGMVTLRGGIPAVFPHLTTPQARSRWATGRDLVGARLVVRGPRRRRLILGHHGSSRVATPEGTSVIAFGPRGSGKSGGLCIPLIQEWDGCVVAASAKSDLIDMAAGVRLRRGKVDVLDPADLTGMATCTWSPIDTCHTFDRSMNLVAWLIDGASGDRRGETEEAAVRILTCALYAAGSLGRTVADVMAWLHDPSGSALAGALLTIPSPDPRPLKWLASISEHGAHERAAWFSSARNLLWLHFEQELGEPGARSTFEPRDLLFGGDDTLFVVLPPPDLERPPSLLTSLLMALVAEAESAPARAPSGRRRPLLLVLDECAETAPIEPLLEYLSRARSADARGREGLGPMDRWHSPRAGGMGITVVATFQDFDGVSVAPAGAVMFLGGEKDARKAPTLDLMHELVRGRLAGPAGDGGGEDREDLLAPDAARQLGPGRAVLVCDRLPPALLWLRSCYRDPELVRRHRDNPFIPGVTRVSSV